MNKMMSLPITRICAFVFENCHIMQALFVVILMKVFEYRLSLLVHKVWDVVYNKWT